MEKIIKGMVVFVITIFLSLPAFAQEDLGKKMSAVLEKGIEEGHWQVSADEVYMWIKTKQKDFIVVDVRPGAEAYKAGHIPGSIHIPYNEILKSENIASLPKDKKIILVCATGQLENLPVVPLRMLGYETYTMAFGYAAWIKGSQSGEAMKSVINKAAAKNYPVEK